MEIDNMREYLLKNNNDNKQILYSIIVRYKITKYRINKLPNC
jgi:hypothetical protein